jgi:chromosome segregation ATPase
MSTNLSPVENPSDEGAAAVQPAWEDLHARLQSAFSPDAENSGDASVTEEAPTINVIDATRRLASATLRQGEVFENFQERIVRLEHGPDVGAIRENVRDLSEALLQITLQAQKNSSETQERFESLSEVMALLSGHMATHRQEVQANIAATTQLSQQLQQLQEEIAGQRAENAQLKQLVLSTGQSLRSALQEDIAAQRTETLQLKELVLSTAQSLRDELSALKDQVAPLDGKFDGQSQRMAAIEAKITTLPEMESSLASMASQVDGLDSAITSLIGRTANLETCSLSVTARAEKLDGIAATLSGRMNDLDSVKGAVAQLAVEDAKLMERLGLVADDLDATKTQVTGLEDAAAALADSSIRSAEGLSMLGNALEAAKTQIFSLNETSEYLTERLRIAEQVVESFTRREKVLAELHARAAQALQTGP